MRDGDNTNQAGERSRILLVDDHPVLRQGLVRLLEQERDLTVCGEAESAEEAMAAIRATSPDLVIVDLSLRGKPGLQLIKDVQSHHPGTRVLVLSMHDEALWAERVLRAGACGYVMKQEKPRTLVARVRQALRGETSVSDAIAQDLLRKVTHGRNRGAGSPEDRLGDRELEVLQLIGQGLSTRDVASAMNISVKTVEAHREHIKQKLNLTNSNDLIRYAVHRFLGK